MPPLLYTHISGAISRMWLKQSSPHSTLKKRYPSLLNRQNTRSHLERSSIILIFRITMNEHNSLRPPITARRHCKPKRIPIQVTPGYSPQSLSIPCRNLRHGSGVDAWSYHGYVAVCPGPELQLWICLMHLDWERLLSSGRCGLWCRLC